MSEVVHHGLHPVRGRMAGVDVDDLPGVVGCARCASAPRFTSCVSDGVVEARVVPIPGVDAGPD
jgi:hypothetical protein